MVVRGHMGGVISFSDEPEDIWLKAGWVFRQILEDVAAQYPDDPAMPEQFEIAEANSGLLIDDLDPETRARFTIAIRNVATGIVAGTIRSGILDKPYGDERTLRQYKESLSELVEIIENSLKK